MKRHLFSRWTALAAGLLAVIALLGWNIWRSYHSLTVRTWQLSSGKLTAPLRAVVLSDLHGSTFGEGQAELIRTVAAQTPDLILLAGDMLNEDAAGTDAVAALVERLCPLAPVYYALGNHELGYRERDPNLPDRLAAAGAVVLEEDYLDAEIAGQAVRIGGLYDYAFAMDGNDSTDPDAMRPELYRFLTEFQSTDRFTLMLSHRPEAFVLGEASQTWQIDLVVSGHDHGGQVVLPLLGGLWAGDQGWFPAYVHGLYRKDLLHIFITSGLGSQKETLPRFNNPPEVAVLDLVPQG